MVDSISSSLSAINAYSTMLNNAASNIANMNTGNYTPVETSMETTADGGVTATTTQATTDTVDLTKEAVDMLVAETGIKLSASVLKTATETQKSILDIIA